MKAVTYQSSNGERIHITPTQEKKMKAAGIWPRCSTGEEYCTVSHGLHKVDSNDPNLLSDTDLAEMIN